MNLVVPSVIVLVGPSGAGKSTWAARHFDTTEIVSSDALRATVGLDEFDQRAGTDAFALLDEIVARRTSRRLTTVIDTVGLDADRRAGWVAAAATAGLPVHAVTFPTEAAVCRSRNKRRTRPVPAGALTGQIKRFAEINAELATEAFTTVVSADDDLRFVNRSMAASDAATARQRGESLPLEFGLQISTFDFEGGSEAMGRNLADIARAAESAGFTSMWVMDHFMQIPQVGPVWGDMPEAYTTLAFLAASTRRIRLGTMVTGTGYRNPALLGKMIATLDVLSGGRAMAGLGAGWYERETVAYGWDLPTTRQRLDRLEDMLRMLPLLWGPGTPSFEGRTFSVPEAMCYPRPLQEHIPILVGGGGEKRTLRLVAEFADAANLMGEPDTVRHKIDVLRRHCEAVDRNPDDISITHLSPALVAEDDASLAAAVEALRPANVSAAQFAGGVNAGTVEDHVGRCRRLAEAGVDTVIISPVAVRSAADIDRLAPLVEAFV